MSFSVFAAVLLAALLHAGWNALVRIGASRVFEISRILGVPIQFFFDDYDVDTGRSYGFAEGGADDGAAMMELLNSPEGVQLCKHFASIKDPKIRKRVLELVKSLSVGDGDGD